MMHFAPCTFTCSCLTMNILWRPPMVYISMTSLHNVIKLKSDWRIQKCNASFELILIPFYLCRNAQFLTESSQKSNNWTYGSLDAELSLTDNIKWDLYLQLTFSYLRYSDDATNSTELSSKNSAQSCCSITLIVAPVKRHNSCLQLSGSSQVCQGIT